MGFLAWWGLRPMCGTGGPAGIRDSPLMYAGVGVLYLPTLHCDRYLASVGFMGKTADIVRPGTSASHPATYECAWGEDWHVLTGRVFDTTWPAGSGPRQVGQTSSPSLVPSSSRLPTGTTAGAALQDEDGPRRRSPPAGPPSPGTRRACLPHHRRSRRCDGGGRGQDDTLAENRDQCSPSPP